MGKINKLFETEALNMAPGAIWEPETNRRIRGNRLDVSFPVYGVYKGSLIQGFMEAVNISWSGMLLATNFPLNAGDLITLDFTLPETDIPISVEARVVHKIQEKQPEEATCIGVAFLNMDPNVRRMISGFVLQYLSHE